MFSHNETEQGGRSALDDVVPGVAATRDFNFPGKTRSLNIHMLAQTGDTSRLEIL